jgi:hypothetical protein
MPCLGGWARREIYKPRAPAADQVHDFEIVCDANVKEAELRIPRRMLLADASTGNTTRVALTGLALSAAFVGGGLWCLRFRGPKIPRKKLIGAGALASLLAGSLVLASFANGNAPAPQHPGIPPVQLGDIAASVRIVDQGDHVQLIVPVELADKIKAR